LTVPSSDHFEGLLLGLSFITFMCGAVSNPARFNEYETFYKFISIKAFLRKTVVSVTNNVRFATKADMCSAKRHVRFGPIADIGRTSARGIIALYWRVSYAMWQARTDPLGQPTCDS
jgi:hypothetical protein